MQVSNNGCSWSRVIDTTCSVSGAVTCGSSELPIVAHHFNTPYNKRLIYQSAHKLYNTATFIVQKTLACNNRRLDDASQ